jgi:hypothetical protein
MLLLGTTLIVSLLAPTAVWASHQFTDVPDSNVFHNSIAWMKDHGITVGCNPPANTKYCPNDPVTRGQMAAFMKRLAENNVVDAATLDGQDSVDLVPGGMLPIGSTLRGSYVGSQYSGVDGFENISFIYELPSKPLVHFIPDGGAAPAACPGSAANPEAAPGHLCVYESTNHVGTTTTSCAIFRPDGPCNDASVFGFIIWYRSTTADAFSYGSWAVTAAATTPLAGSTSSGVGGQ